MRVAHVLSGGPGPDVANGVRKHLYFLSREQAALGLDVALFCLTTERVVVPGVFARAFAPSAIPFRVPSALLDELDRWRPDFVHLHQPYFPPNAALARWALRAGIPYAVTPHGALSPGEIRQRWHLKVPYKYLFELPTLNRAAFVQSVGAAEHLDRYGVIAPIVLAPTGIDLTTAAAELDPGALARREPALRGLRIFLFLGRLDPEQKGLDVLVRAFARAALTDAALVLAGPDFRGGRRRLDRLVATLRPRAPVLLLGPVHGKDKLDLLAGAHVFVHTSRWEGAPNAVLEAAVHALPALLTPPADPLGRLSLDGGGVVVELEPDAVADGLRRIAGMDPQALRTMGERARAVVAEFTWAEAARILAAAYARYGSASGSNGRGAGRAG